MRNQSIGRFQTANLIRHVSRETYMKCNGSEKGLEICLMPFDDMMDKGTGQRAGIEEKMNVQKIDGFQRHLFRYYLGANHTKGCRVLYLRQDRCPPWKFFGHLAILVCVSKRKPDTL